MTSIINTTNSTLQNRTFEGAEHDSLPEDIITSVLLFAYIVVAVVGLFGNILTCYIIIKKKFMRKVIHFYTLNLAIADLIVIIFYVPVEIIKNENNMIWTMGEPLCRINYCVIPLSLAASISTLIAITLNRHRGVTKPLQWRSDTRSIIKVSIPLIWIASLITCAPFLYVVVLKEFPPGSGNYYCYEEWNDRNKERAYWITMFCVQVLFPLIVMIILNTHMLVIMKGYRLRHKKKHKRIIRLIVVLVVIYAVCTSPQHIVYFWLSYGDVSDVTTVVQQTVFKVANLLVIIQMAVNPIIYGTIGELRRSFVKILTIARFKTVLSFRQVQACQSNPAILDQSDPEHSPNAGNQTPETYRDDQFDFDG